MKKQSNLGLVARMAVLTFLLCAGAALNSALAQIVIDGQNCDGNGGPEWPDSTASVDVGDPTGIPSSGDYHRMWFNIYEDTIAFAFTRHSSTTGNSAFSLFFDTDCDPSSGNTTWGGAEVAMFFNIGSGTIISNKSVYTYNGGTWTQSMTNAFYGFLGDSTCGATNYNFFEFAINVNNLVDVCNIGGAGSCNGMTLTYAISNAGGTFGSAAKDVFEIDRFVFINEPPVVDITPTDVCLGVNTEFSAANSTENTSVTTDYDGIVAWAWDFDNDGAFDDGNDTFASWTFNSLGTHKVRVQIEDKFGCIGTDSVNVTVSSVNADIAILITDSANLLCPSWEFTSYYVGTTDTADLAYYIWTMPDGHVDTTVNTSPSYGHRFNTACYWDLNGDPIGQFQVTAVSKIGCTDVAGDIFVPVELVYFTGSVMDGAAHLKWQTATEINSDYFLVEKSLDGEVFVPIQRVQAAGNSVHLNDYMVIDPHMENGNVYYRLSQFDFNGAFEVFAPIVLNKEDMEGRISVSPNPGRDEIRVVLPETRLGGEITVMDLTGRAVLVEAVDASKSSNVISLDVSILPEGLYYVRFGNDKEGYTSQLIQLL